MSPSNPTLEQLQHWLQAVITHPGGVEEGARAAAQLEAIIPPTSRQTSAERLGVYAAAYYLRLVDCLREFFPCLRHAMGDDIFSDFALAYLQKHPSQSYTLHHLADQFANFLAETKPSPQGGTEEPAGWEEFFVELARLEHAIEIVFDAEGPEESSAPGSVPTIPSPPGSGQGEGLTPQSALTFVPGFQLLAFRYPVSSYYTAWKRGEGPPLPPPGEEQIALFRCDYIVRRHELTPIQHALLAALQTGETLEEALASIAFQAFAAGQSTDTLAADLREWFERWTRAGFFPSA